MEMMSCNSQDWVIKGIIAQALHPLDHLSHKGGEAFQEADPPASVKLSDDRSPGRHLGPKSHERL